MFKLLEIEMPLSNIIIDLIKGLQGVEYKDHQQNLMTCIICKRQYKEIWQGSCVPCMSLGEVVCVDFHKMDGE